MSVEIVAALAAAFAAGPTNTVSESVAIPPKLVEEFVAKPHPKCLDASFVHPASRPRVVSTFPAEGQAVRPGLVVVRITFDRPMTCSGFVLKASRLPSPCPRNKQRFLMAVDHKTIRTLCMAGPAKAYGLTFGRDLLSFQSVDGGQPANPYVVRFRTSDGPEVSSLAEALSEDADAPDVKTRLEASQ